MAIKMPCNPNIDADWLASLDPEDRMKLTACLQCARCSSGCTMRQETDLLPHQINRMALMGMEKQLLESRAIWLCASCQTCVSRCPMEVDTPTLIDKLRAKASKAPEADVERVRVFNETMLDSMRKFGRVYEFGMMGTYKLKTRDFMSDLAKFPTMLMKGKMKLVPPMTKGRKAVAAIFDKVRSSRRAGR